MMPIVGIWHMEEGHTTAELAAEEAVLGVADADSRTRDNPVRALQAADGVLEIHHRANDKIQWTTYKKRARHQYRAHITRPRITSLLMETGTAHAVLGVEVAANVQTQWVN